MKNFTVNIIYNKVKTMFNLFLDQVESWLQWSDKKIKEKVFLAS